MVAPEQPASYQSEQSSTGFTSRIYDEQTIASNGTKEAIEWITYWELAWPPVPGAIDYLIYYTTSEGTSPTPRTSAETRWRISIARNSESPDKNCIDWQARLAMLAAQLQVIMQARFADGSVGPPSPPFPIGETLTE